jgi:hypothetical protein
VEEPVKAVEDNLVQVEEVKKPDKTVRVQELVECPDCKKMITPKSFKYSHKKTCSANKTTDNVIESKPTKPKEKAKKEVQPEQQETQQPETIQPPQVPKPLTAEEKRREAIRAREDRLTNLFMSTLRR